MGVTFTNFQMWTLPVLKDLLNNIVKGLMIWYFASFKTVDAIQSGPGSLFALILSSALVIASSLKLQSLNGIKLGWAGVSFWIS